ncbi:hypothetical protein GQR60_05160 [Labilibaculum sp. A4]|uniref:hypothetical protein n=1 Tax=Labilibaculum euxinus TaxID=2686357 RepID=UPI000F61AB49|nr:hypothetical protein [Labilibaculum euxinus]MDQ1771931.1 hypothetical protein [Labilibaculum euxinus]MWN75719.1 hypothetical protein [Labilibaculum euxinus]
MDKKISFWAPLDNAAKIFPAIRSKEHSTVARITAVLNERVAIKHLFSAIELAEKRFPYFKVSLRKGFFWYYLEQIDDPVKVTGDTGRLCQAFDRKDSNKLLFRILVRKNEISVEFSHILTDGAGLLQFLKAILIYYFNEKGMIPEEQIDPFYTSKANPEEFEDAYNRYFKEKIPHVIRQQKAFHLPFDLNPKPRFDVLLAMISTKELKERASEKSVSITIFLVAVYLLVLQDIFHECKVKGKGVRRKLARIQVPINLRNIYPTKTMRNFSLFVLPELDFRLGLYSFDEIVKIVHHKMELETDEKLISKIISRNVGGERNVFVRSIPILLKSLVLYAKYYAEGANQFSGVVTNLGNTKVPDAIADQINYFVITPPPPNKKVKINCGVIGYKDKLVLSFGNISNSKEFERRFLRFLVEQNVKVKILNTYHEQRDELL